MKSKLLLLCICILFTCSLAAQPGKKKPVKEKAPTQSEMDKMMDEATKGMSAEDKADMKKMMGDMMPEISKKPGSSFTPFTDNKSLVPAKDQARINSIQKKAFTDADAAANANILYNKLMLKIPAAEKSIILKVKEKDGYSLMSAALTCLMQGHHLAAMA